MAEGGERKPVTCERTGEAGDGNTDEGERAPWVGGKEKGRSEAKMKERTERGRRRRKKGSIRRRRI